VEPEACSGVVRVRFNDKRYTRATLLLEDGATERYVAERLGDTVEMIHETSGGDAQDADRGHGALGQEAEPALGDGDGGSP
jgi:hypothetical protein